MERLPLQFIRWGAGLLVLGLLTGNGPLHHYLSGGVEVACPWAPTHGPGFSRDRIAVSSFDPAVPRSKTARRDPRESGEGEDPNPETPFGRSVFRIRRMIDARLQ